MSFTAYSVLIVLVSSFDLGGWTIDLFIIFQYCYNYYFRIILTTDTFTTPYIQQKAYIHYYISLLWILSIKIQEKSQILYPFFTYKSIKLAWMNTVLGRIIYCNSNIICKTTNPFQRLELLIFVLGNFIIDWSSEIFHILYKHIKSNGYLTISFKKRMINREWTVIFQM